ncbi:MAG: hypothetical protein GF333_01770 [Candidatus Omnitrophica bacterium]|nr:hypothetical protein [Candidatus Omnitrophota bacterium]
MRDQALAARRPAARETSAAQRTPLDRRGIAGGASGYRGTGKERGGFGPGGLTDVQDLSKHGAFGAVPVETAERAWSGKAGPYPCRVGNRPSVPGGAVFPPPLHPFFRGRGEAVHGQAERFKKGSFFVVLVNSRNMILSCEEVGQGTVDCVSLFLREIFQKAFEQFASGVLCVHNHPSGDPHPSRPDREFTRQLNQCAQVLQLRFLDHVIIGDNTYFSFADEGLLVPDAAQQRGAAPRAGYRSLRRRCSPVRPDQLRKRRRVCG